MDIESIIKFENENTYVDFKKTQYKNNDDFLKDIMSMANANIENNKRYIICGVKHLPDGNREYHSIPESEFKDDSIYQGLVREYIEPEIQFQYYPYYIEGVLLGIFEITGCNNRPYVLKKQSKILKMEQGACFIRRGSQIGRAIREDFEAIYEVKYTKRRELEIKNSYLHLLKHEFNNNSLLLWRINTFISVGPIIKELWNPADSLSQHFVIEAWDSLLRSGVIASLEFEEMEHYRYAVKTMREAIYYVREAKANWLRILEWNNPVVVSNSAITELRQSPSPLAIMEQYVRNCKEAIDTAQKAIQIAVKNLEKKHKI